MAFSPITPPGKGKRCKQALLSETPGNIELFSMAKNDVITNVLVASGDTSVAGTLNLGYKGVVGNLVLNAALSPGMAKDSVLVDALTAVAPPNSDYVVLADLSGAGAGPYLIEIEYITL